MQKQKLEGKLLYIGWNNLPWALATTDGEINLWPIVDEFLISLNGKRVSQKQTRNEYELFADKNSGFQLDYVPEKYVLLKKIEGFGGANVAYYLETSLIWLSGRRMKISVKNGIQMKIVADTSEKVYYVYFVRESSSCKVPSDAVKTVCKVGESDCCIFFSMGNSGPCCEKFNSSVARTLLNDLSKGITRARRIGGCALGQK
jgi:hypothetical protein